MIRHIKVEDSDQICNIYNHYVKNTIITFEEESVSEAEMQERIKNTPQNLPWLVFVEENRIYGYAFTSAWKSRCAYKNSVESTIYLDKDLSGKGIGSLLYQELLDRLRKLNYHTVIAGIALPNEKSIRLHEKFGFEKVAHFKEVGYKFNCWIDVGYWQLVY